MGGCTLGKFNSMGGGHMNLSDYMGGRGLWKGGRALSPFFGPPRKPKIKSYFTTFSLDCFIR